jgi:hypothetical protein
MKIEALRNKLPQTLNASAVKIYNTTSSPVRFENKCFLLGKLKKTR